MTNFEKALRILNEKSIVVEPLNSIEQFWAVSLEKAIEICKLAANPDWKYPLKGEFPKNNKYVLMVFAKSFTPEIVCYEKGFFISTSGERTTMPEVWCELPVFNKA